MESIIKASNESAQSYPEHTLGPSILLFFYIFQDSLYTENKTFIDCSIACFCEKTYNNMHTFLRFLWHKQQSYRKVTAPAWLQQHPVGRLVQVKLITSRGNVGQK